MGHSFWLSQAIRWQGIVIRELPAEPYNAGTRNQRSTELTTSNRNVDSDTLIIRLKWNLEVEVFCEIDSIVLRQVY
jgi:hypothetical protein